MCCHDLSHFIIENGPPTPLTKTLSLLSQIITKCMHYKSMILCNFFSQKLQVIELFLYRRKLLMANPTASWPQRLGNWLFLRFKLLYNKPPLITSRCSVGHLGSVVPILKCPQFLTSNLIFMLKNRKNETLQVEWKEPTSSHMFLLWCNGIFFNLFFNYLDGIIIILITIRFRSRKWNPEKESSINREWWTMIAWEECQTQHIKNVELVGPQLLLLYGTRSTLWMV